MALGRKAFGMHALAQKRAHAGAMEHQPGNGFPSPLGVAGEQASGLVGQVQQDGGRLEHGDARGGVMQHGNAAMGIQRQESGMAVLPLFDAHMVEGPLGELSV
ncbi:hypothetical protein G6F24_018245 [Rhizopus arrhizus]|nr:hypothetical protein G6F24_018245 [Rhizopus arrhizus]